VGDFQVVYFGEEEEDDVHTHTFTRIHTNIHTHTHTHTQAYPAPEVAWPVGVSVRWESGQSGQRATPGGRLPMATLQEGEGKETEGREYHEYKNRMNEKEWKTEQRFKNNPHKKETGMITVSTKNTRKQRYKQTSTQKRRQTNTSASKGE
jgi:hypothetical protein